MKKLVLIILCLTAFFQSSNLFASFENAMVTIVITDKEGNPKQNLDFDIMKGDNSLVSKGKTNAKGQFKTKLKKGINYFIYFNQDGNEWNFSLAVPNKPGPRAYKFSFKVYTKTKREVVYKTVSDFDTQKKDPSLCETKICLRDESGMPLPYQVFILETRDTKSRIEYATDIEGKYTCNLKKGSKYNLITQIEDNDFNTYLNISSDADILDFYFDIDFSKMHYTIVDTVYDEYPDSILGDIKTIIRVVNVKGVLEADVEIVIEESNRRLFSAISDEAGEADTLLNRRKVYEVFVRKMGKTYMYEMILPQDPNIKEFILTAEVDFQFKPKRTFTLGINFDTGSSKLRKNDIPEMEKLYQMVADNTKMYIEVGGHTDNVGAARGNQRLSERRAKTCATYLHKKGIEKKRVLFKGYGEGRPVATNKTKQGRQLNRRIDVSVLAE